jgi:hypothetical protein
MRLNVLVALAALAACSQPPAPAPKLPPTRDAPPSIGKPVEPAAEPAPSATTADPLVDDDRPATFNADSAGTSSADLKGDPFLLALTADALRDFTSPPGAQDARAVGCIRILPDGTVPETKLQTPSGNAALDAAAETSLAAVKARRNASPTPVPEHLKPQLTTKWLCFRFTATS